MNTVTIPRMNWILIDKKAADVVFVCPICRMFSRLDAGVRVGVAGLTSGEVSCIRMGRGCDFSARLRFEEWREKTEELQKWKE